MSHCKLLRIVNESRAMLCKPDNSHVMTYEETGFIVEVNVSYCYVSNCQNAPMKAPLNSSIICLKYA
jgi:hypothetical protein